MELDEFRKECNKVIEYLARNKGTASKEMDELAENLGNEEFLCPIMETEDYKGFTHISGKPVQVLFSKAAPETTVMTIFTRPDYISNFFREAKDADGNPVRYAYVPMPWSLCVRIVANNHFSAIVIDPGQKDSFYFSHDGKRLPGLSS